MSENAEKIIGPSRPASWNSSRISSRASEKRAKAEAARVLVVFAKRETDIKKRLAAIKEGQNVMEADLELL